MAVTVLPVRSEDPPRTPEERTPPVPVEERRARPGRQVHVATQPERPGGDSLAGLPGNSVDLTYVSRRRRIPR